MARSFLGSSLPCILACLVLSPAAHGQLGGSRAGVDGEPAGVPNLPELDRDVVESHIAINGRAEIRIPPTEIRIVMAVTGEGKDAQTCRGEVDRTVQNLKAAWGKSGIAPQKIVEDFIAVLPRYQWQLERQGDADVGVEKKVGYRMQTNLHLAVPDGDKAQAALNLAFELGVTDIIAFDYWSRELDAKKVKAQEQALQAAMGKADLLFGPLLLEQPQVINVQEQTIVRFPESLYHSFTNSVDESVAPAWRRDTSFIRAARPQNTYYRGLHADTDIQSGELPMSPEISVISTVRVYYRSPHRE